MASLSVRGADVLVGDGWQRADVHCDDGRISWIGNSSDGRASTHETIDATGLFLAPGFIDLQVNGLAGVDLTSQPERLDEVAVALLRHGVTAFCPTVVTSAPTQMERAIATLADSPSCGGARILGWHAEGPMLSPNRRGAHARVHLQPASLDVVRNWSAALGVAMVTIAPELPGAREVVEHLNRAGIVVFAGHTDVTADQLRDAVDAGVRGLTHLFNAMAGLGHREPGPVGVAFTDDRVVAGIIADGVHVHPSIVAIAYREMGSRLFLVSDSVSVAGSPPGTYRLGNATLYSDGVSVRLSDGTLAGSLLTLDVAVRNLMAFTGCSAANAMTAATRIPADVVGATRLGRIEVGAAADLVLLTRALEVVRTIVNGACVYER